MEVDNNQEKIMQKKQEIDKVIEKILKDILEKYKMTIDQISNDHFNVFDEVMQSEMQKKFDVMKAGEIFKKKLYETVEKRFTAMWRELDMDGCVAAVEVSKQEAKANTSNWRPANVSTEDLVRPYLMKIFARKRKFLQEQIAVQEKQISEIVLEIEHARGVFQNQKDKRARLLAQIEADSLKIQEAHSRIDEMIDNEL